MERPGEYLKRERELRGIRLEDASSALKLSKRTLKALEDDNYEILPHPTYVKGFISAYCRHLGIDDNDCVLRYEEYLREKAEIEQEAKPAGPPASGGPAIPGKTNAVTVFILLAAGIVAIVFYFVYLKTPYEKPPIVEPEKGVALPGEGPKANDAMEEKDKEEIKKPAQVIETPHEAPKPRPAAKESELGIRAIETTWIKAEIDSTEVKEVLIREGESVRWSAREVFFCT